MDRTVTASNNSRPGPAQGARQQAPAGSGRRRGMNKAALGRVKLAALAFSAVAFVGALAGIAQANPHTASNTAVANPPPAVVAQTDGVNQAPQLRSSAPSSVAPLALPQRPRMPQIRPMGRTRGS